MLITTNGLPLVIARSIFGHSLGLAAVAVIIYGCRYCCHYPYGCLYFCHDCCCWRCGCHYLSLSLSLDSSECAYGLQQLVAATYALGSAVQIDYFGSGNATSTERAAIYLSALLHLYSGVTNIYVAGTDGEILNAMLITMPINGCKLV